MVYATKTERISRFIERIIMIRIEERQLDYYKLIGEIAKETQTTEKDVEKVLKNYIISGKFVEHRSITLPDSVALKVIEKREKIQKEVNKELEKAGVSKDGNN